jgi:hypothetical protein
MAAAMLQEGLTSSMSLASRPVTPMSLGHGSRFRIGR